MIRISYGNQDRRDGKGGSDLVVWEECESRMRMESWDGVGGGRGSMKEDAKNILSCFHQPLPPQKVGYVTLCEFSNYEFFIICSF